MKSALLTVLLACCAFAETPQQILAHVQTAYTRLHAFHSISVRVQTITAGPASAQSNPTEYELAEMSGGRFRARWKTSDQEAISVSDGSVTWKALPKARQWSKVNAAGLNHPDAQAEDDAPSAKDLHSIVKEVTLLRYIVIAKLGKEPVLVKEDNYKLGKEKRLCDVVRTHIQDTVYELWVDQKTGFVLQEIQTNQSESGGVKIETKLTTKAKLIEVDDAVQGSAFQFTPEASWQETEMLVLPGEDRVSLAGLKAADFSAKSLDGDTVALSSLRGKVVVLDFWATWCPPCREELPVIDKLRAEFTDKVQFYGVNDEDAGTVRDFLRKTNNGLATLMDQKETVHREYGVRAIPTLLVIDREGVIRSHFIGGRSPEAIRAAIEKAVATP